MNKIFKVRGGLTIGENAVAAVNFTWPFVIMEIDGQGIILRLFNKKYIFEREAIVVKQYRGLFSKGIKINHGKAEIRPFVVFWTFQLKPLINCLDAYNYKMTQL